MIYRCINPECGLRIPLPNADERCTCPRCGSSVQADTTPIISQAVPRLEEDGSLPVIVPVLDNIRSALNVGSIFRSCEGAGIKEIYLCGISPTPDNSKVKKTALGAEEAVRWQHDWALRNTLEQLKAEGVTIWALEGGPTAQNLFHAIKSIPDMQKVALIVGNEVSGVDPEGIELADRVVYLPMMGGKESLNVAAAFGIAAYLMRFGRMIDER